MTEEEKRRAWVVPVYPSERVIGFLKERPDADWRDCLRYLLDHFPQSTDGEIQWLVEGGTAVHLLNPARRLPKDVDVVTKSQEMAKEFTNSRKFDVKTVFDWFEDRFLIFSEEMATFLLSQDTTVNFEGRKVYTLNPLTLAVSKMVPWRRVFTPREQDIDDIRLLSVDQQEVRSMIQKFRILPIGHSNRTYQNLIR